MRRHELGLVAAFFAAVAVIVTWPLATRAGSAMTAQPFGDPLLNAWILAWNADRLRHGLADYWTAPFFYPWPDTLAYSEHLFGLAIFTAPVQWATGNPILAFNLALMGTVVLAGLGMYLLAREASGRADAALLGAVAFACSPYRVPQIYHLQVLAWGWMPMALWALHRYIAARAGAEASGRMPERPQAARWLAVFVAAFLLQGLSNGYYLYFQAVPVAVLVLAALWRHRAAARRIVRDLAAAAIVIPAGLAPFVIAYLRVRREQGLSRNPGDIAQYAPDLLAFTHVDPRLWLWGGVLPRGDYERELFPGLTIVLLAATGLASAWLTTRRSDAEYARARTAGLYAIVLVVGALLVLGIRPQILGWSLPFPGPYAWLVATVPGFSGLRVPARMAVVVYLSLSVLGALGAAVLLERMRRRAARVATAALALLVGAEGYGGPIALDRVPTPDMAADRAAYEWLAAQPRGPMLELPVGDVRLGVRHLYRTLVHGNRIVNGYSGYGSLLQDFAGGPPFTETEGFGEALEMLRAIGVRWLLVHRALYADPVQADAIARAAAGQAAHVARVQEFGTVMILELRPLVAPPPAALSAWSRVPSVAITATASHNQARVALAFDGNPGTRWLSAGPQTGTEWIEIRLDRPRNLARLRIEMDRRSLPDYPRGLVVEGSVEGGHFAPLWEGSAITALGLGIVREPRSPAIDIGFTPNETRVLRLRATAPRPRWNWSVPEIVLFERP